MKSFGIISILVFLNACSPYQSGFDCPAGKGQPCTSLYKVNKMVDRGEIGQLEEEEPISSSLPKNLTSQNSLKIYFPSRTDVNGCWHGSKSAVIPRIK